MKMKRRSVQVALSVGTGLAFLQQQSASADHTWKMGETGKTVLEVGTTVKTESKVTTHKPMDLIAIIDFSGSVSDFERKSKGYTGPSVRKQQLTSMRNLIQNALTDEDQVTFGIYGTNSETSYAVGVEGARMTPLMSKKDAVSFLNQLIADNGIYQNAVASTLIPNLQMTDAPGTKKGDGFEEIYQRFTTKKSLVSVIQYTDGWVGGEKIDSSFATWAKANAKTFMSVIHSDGYSSDGIAEPSMKQAGHPNIVTSSKPQSELEDAFRSTATETAVTKVGHDDSLTVTINDTKKGIEFKSITLISPSGKRTTIPTTSRTYTIPKVSEAGKWKLEVEYTSNQETEASSMISLTRTNVDDGKDKTEAKSVETYMPQTGTKPLGTLYEADPTLNFGEVALKQEMVPEKTINGKKSQEGKPRIIRVGTKPVSHSQNTRFKTIYQENKNMTAGEKKEIRAGKEGVIASSKNYTLTRTSDSYREDADYKDIKKVSQGVVKEVAGPGKNEQAVDRLIEVGTKPVTVRKELPFETHYETRYDKLIGTPDLVVREGKTGSTETTTKYTLDLSTGNVTPLVGNPVVIPPVHKEVIQYRGKQTRWIMHGKNLAPSEIGKDFGEGKNFDNLQLVETKEEGPVKTYVYLPTRKIIQRFFDTNGVKIKPDYVIYNQLTGDTINVGHPWGIDYQGTRYYPVLEKLPIEVVTIPDKDVIIDYVYDKPVKGEPNVPLVEKPKVETPKVEKSKVEAPKVESPKIETPKVETPKAEQPKIETPKIETPKIETPKVEEPKVETPKVETPKVETPKVETPRVETPKVETPKVEEPKVETPKVETPKVEEPKVETPKAETPKAETPKVEPPKVEKPMVEEPKEDKVGKQVEVPKLPPKEEPKTDKGQVELPKERKVESPNVTQRINKDNSQTSDVTDANKSVTKASKEKQLPQTGDVSLAMYGGLTLLSAMGLKKRKDKKNEIK